MDPVKFVQRHGVVLESGHGPRRSLAEAIAGEPIRRSWWAHRKGREIFWATRQVRESPEVLVCRLIDGKVTYVHRRLWPALVRLADRFPSDSLARLHEEHLPSGRHRVRAVQYPEWVLADVQREAHRLSEGEAVSQVGKWIKTCIKGNPKRPGRGSKPRLPGSKRTVR